MTVICTTISNVLLTVLSNRIVDNHRLVTIAGGHHPRTLDRGPHRGERAPHGSEMPQWRIQELLVGGDDVSCLLLPTPFCLLPASPSLSYRGRS